METKNSITKEEFHTVDFMRKVRNELSEEYLTDKQKYLENLKKVMADFKARQKAYR